MVSTERPALLATTSPVASAFNAYVRAVAGLAAQRAVLKRPPAPVRFSRRFLRNGRARKLRSAADNVLCFFRNGGRMLPLFARMASASLRVRPTRFRSTRVRSARRGARFAQRLRAPRRGAKRPVRQNRGTRGFLRLRRKKQRHIPRKLSARYTPRHRCSLLRPAFLFRRLRRRRLYAFVRAARRLARPARTARRTRRVLSAFAALCAKKNPSKRVRSFRPRREFRATLAQEWLLFRRRRLLAAARNRPSALVASPCFQMAGLNTAYPKLWQSTASAWTGEPLPSGIRRGLPKLFSPLFRLREQQAVYLRPRWYRVARLLALRAHLQRRQLRRELTDSAVFVASTSFVGHLLRKRWVLQGLLEVGKIL